MPALLVLVLPFISLLMLAAIFTLWERATCISTALRRSWYGFLIGTFSGFGYYGVSLYWLGNAFIAPHESGHSLRSILGGTAAMLIFVPWWSIAMSLAAFLRSFAGASALSAALIWTVCMSMADTLLGDILFGIPLGPLSAVLFGSPSSMIFAYVGLFGANFIMLLSASLAVTAISSCAVSIKPPMAIVALSLTLTVPALLPAPMRKTAAIGSDSPVVAVVQPAGAQRIRPTYFDRVSWMDDLNRLMSTPDAKRSRIVVLPELSLPFDPDLEPADDLVTLLQIPSPSTFVLYGHYHTAISDAASEFYATTNRISIAQGGAVLGVYDKAYPVPFGEFMPAPFRWLGFKPFTGTAEGLEAGSQIKTWRLGADVPAFGILICYEAALSGAVMRETRDAEWLINPTSEVMLGDSLGPALVLQYARIRALETGKPIYRAAQTGWSAIIDGSGAVVRALPPKESGVIAAPIPERRRTVFSEIGYIPLYAGWIICVLATIFRRMVSSRGRA